MDTQKLISHIEAFETQAANLEKALKKIPKDQTDPDGINTYRRVQMDIQGIRDGIERDKSRLRYEESRQEIELTIEELAQQQAAAKLRQNEIDKLADEIVQQATQKT